MAEEKKKTVRKKPAAEKTAAPKKAVKKKAVEKTAAPAPAEAVVKEVEKAAAHPVERPASPHAEAKPHRVVHHVKKVKKPVEKHIDRFHATGRRKTATARVWLSPGNGKVTVNQQPAEVYFCGREQLMKQFNQPFVLTETGGKFDVVAIVNGGGVPSQADALRMGISRALALAVQPLRKKLRVTGMLTRDPREKERKKYGLKRARRAFQFSKR